MLKGSDKQGSFFDTEYLCERLISSDSFYRKFREVVAPLIKDEDFDAMYCKALQLAGQAYEQTFVLLNDPPGMDAVFKSLTRKLASLNQPFGFQNYDMGDFGARNEYRLELEVTAPYPAPEE